MSRRWLVGCGLAVIFATTIWMSTKVTTSPSGQRPQPSDDGSRSVVESDFRSGHNRDNHIAVTESIIQVNPTEVLAVVNGKQLKLPDLVPWNPVGTNQDLQFSHETFNYLLDRALNRELILQTARNQGVGLDDSQRQQLAEFRQQRTRREPGLVEALNRDSTQADFEMRDAEAFMLQATLLEKAGASPNVTAEDVKAYYAQHAREFEGLPSDEIDGKQDWTKIDVQIRNLLAPIKREKFQSQMIAYMDQIKAKSNIIVTPMP